MDAQTRPLMNGRSVRSVATVGIVALMSLVALAFEMRSLAPSFQVHALGLRAAAPLPHVGPLSPGSDLVISSIALSVAVPDLNEPFDVTVVVRNRGNSPSGGFRTYLYVDPADQPPLPGTADTSWTYRFGLNPGESFSWRYSGVELAELGCDHVIYAWVDKESEVAEDDETNNVSSVRVCAGATATPTSPPTATPTNTPTPCVPDQYEPDNSCDTANEIAADGTQQIRNLCPVGDVDWVRLTARAGITYTIGTSAVGVDADTALSLYASCGGAPIASADPPDATVAQIVWACESSGNYYIAVRHHSAAYGSEASYQLSVVASTGCPGDLYESDDNCSAAREIETDGSAQRRLFCSAQDQDWVKLKATSGSTVIIRTDNLGPDAEPMLSIYDACDVPLSLGHPQQLEWIAPTDEIYYLKLENRDPQKYGPTTYYDLSVATLGCQGDDFEFEGGDDTADKALVVGVGAPPTSHNLCPAGDEDWVRFEARAGREYVIETSNLGPSADTQLCLFGPDGTTSLGCDDDGTGTNAARLIWQCPAAGTYYVRTRHYDPSYSGPSTGYDLSVSVGVRVDSFEPDNSRQWASPLSVNGNMQTHSFSPSGDEDWLKFVATPGQYAIQTMNLDPGCDTVLELYAPDGTTLLARNDDFGFGLSSRISYTIPYAGTYYARVINYRPSRFGANMKYDLLVVTGTPPAGPTPPPLPSPTIPPAPPASAVKTLIVYNRERVQALYGPDAATRLVAKLYTLASHPRVLAQVIQVETDAAVAAAYSAWTADLLSTAKANDVAASVRNLVLTYLARNPNVEYIVIVGSDAVVPFRRTPDRTEHPESRYQVYVSSATSIWAACGDDMTLTDNYYADLEPTAWSGGELYIPDYAIGRLVESPEEIIGLVDLFLTESTVTIDRALVSGYDFIKDVAQAICSSFGSDLGSGNVDCALIGEAWNGSQLKAKQLDAAPRFDLQAINGHANYSTEGAPNVPNVGASEIATWGAADLTRALIFTLGCHSGLNDVGALPRGLDLAQAFSQRGANYVANTGYGWGLGDSIGLSERLMQSFTEELLTGGSAIIGTALMEAKQRYYAETTNWDEYDDKVVSESTLYALPMYEIYTGGTLSEDPFPSVVITTALPLPADGLLSGQLDIGLSQSFASLGETTTATGTFYDLDGHTQVGASQPVQPKFYADISRSGAARAHGAILVEATYSDTVGFDPVIPAPVNEYLPASGEPTFAAPGWYPAVPFATSRMSAAEGETLVAALGQYNSVGGIERLYDRMSFEVLYSDSPDWWPPYVASVDAVLLRQAAQIKVEALDASDVKRVVVVYPGRRGTQQSHDLAYDAASGKWMGEIPADEQTTFYVQVVDGAGNVAVVDNKGAGFGLERVEAGPESVYLPLALRLH